MRVSRTPKCDVGGNSSVTQTVSLADETTPRSGGGGINLMGAELAWSPGNVVSDDQQ